MPKKKGMQLEAEEEEEQVDWAPKLSQPVTLANVRVVLDRIKAKEGVIGYIVRGPTSASVDIKDPSKIIDYAALSAEAMDSGDCLSEAFGLGGVCNIVLEGRNIKMLLLRKGEQELTVFMEKNVNHNDILNELS